MCDFPDLANDGEPIASVQDYASLDFEGLGSDLRNAVGTPGAWLNQAREDYNIMVFATLILQRDAPGMEIMAKQSGDEFVSEALDRLQSFRERHEAYAGVVHSAEARLLCGWCRHGMATGVLPDG